MKVVAREDIYTAKNNGIALWPFVQSNNAVPFLNSDEKAKIIKWIERINVDHHNQMGFTENFRNIFTVNDVCEVLDGQVDYGAIRLGNEAIVIGTAEMGVFFQLSSMTEKLNAKSITQQQWNNYQTMLTALEVAFINAKDFHILADFTSMNNEVPKKDVNNQNKVKI